MRCIEATPRQAIIVCCLLFISIFQLGQLAAREQEPGLPKPPVDQPEVKLDLSIEQAMQAALSNNLSISVERKNIDISEANIQTAKGVFDPTLFTATSVRRTVVPVSSALSNIGGSAPLLTTEEENQDLNVGVRTLLKLGTSVDLEFSVNRLESTTGFRSLLPQYTPNLDFNVTQPLLRNFGRDVTINQITVARTNRTISKQRFRQRVIDIVAQTRNTYWDLVFAIGDLDVRKGALRLAQELVEINKAQVQVGTLAPIEILQAQARAAQRDEDVIVGEKLVADAIDRLKRVMNVFESPLVTDLVITPSDQPRFTDLSIDLNEQIRLAIKNQPTLIQRRLDLKNFRLNVKVRRNRLLPVANLQASAGLNGLAGTAKRGISPYEGDFSDSIDRMFTGNFYELRFGFNFEFPLFNRAARGLATRAKLELERAELELRDSEQETVRQVSEAVRSLTTNGKRIASTRIARQLAFEQLEAEQKRFSVGLSTSFNVLEFQEDLATAQRNDLKAIIDYNQAQNTLNQLTATILEKHRIELDLN